ncbi:MAG: HupE/UreJ family protein [Myxococcota bacterium]
MIRVGLSERPHGAASPPLRQIERVSLTAILLAVGLAIVLARPNLVEAHGLAPALLAVEELPVGADSGAATAADAVSYQVSWTAPAASSAGLTIEWPGECAVVGTPRRFYRDRSAVERFELRCAAGGLAGRTVTITGLGQVQLDVLLRITTGEGRSMTAVLHDGESAFTVPATAQVGHGAVLPSYVALGVEHILLGIDHLLFVLGLLLLVQRPRDLLWTITAFTVGHSVTLSVAALGWIAVPSAPVEAIIALSIVFLAREVICDDPDALARRAPWLVAIGFGLLHGFGFAGALAETGLPDGDIPLALLSFNVGVELGQVAFVAVAVVAWRALRPIIAQPRRSTIAVACTMGALAGWWCVERVTQLG